ncbi:hypothetical protein D3C76_1727930 [compost metagenome]
MERSLCAQLLPRCDVTSSKPRATNLVAGTAMLAMKMIKAISQAPWAQNSITPLMMVLSSPLPSILVFITGSKLAGI